jgi:hypothetical protein
VEGKPLCGMHARSARRAIEEARAKAELEEDRARQTFGDREVPDGWRKAWRDLMDPDSNDPDERFRIEIEAIYKLREYEKNAKS